MLEFEFVRRGVWKNKEGYSIFINEDSGMSFRLIYNNDLLNPIGRRYRSVEGAVRSAENHFKSNKK